MPTAKPNPTVHRLAPGVLATRLDSAQAFPRHAHDTYGIGRIQRGAQRSWSAAGWVEAGPGDLLMVNPGEVHDGMPLDAAGRRWHMLYLAPALVEAAAAEVLPARSPLPMWRPVASDPVVAHAFERWHARLRARGPPGLRRGPGRLAGGAAAAAGPGGAVTVDIAGHRARASGWTTIPRPIPDWPHSPRRPT